MYKKRSRIDQRHQNKQERNIIRKTSSSQVCEKICHRNSNKSSYSIRRIILEKENRSG